MSGEVKVREEEGQLTLESDMFAGEPDDDLSDWEAVVLDNERVLLKSKKNRQPSKGKINAMANCSIDVFANFMSGLNQRNWSGVVTVDMASGMKKLYVRDGEIVFARSNVIDDRLGEVIYRSDAISLDQLTQSAVQVTREIKFGQVLLRSGIFTSVDLWNALKTQIRDIIRSVFLGSMIYFEVDHDSESAPTEVVFPEGTRALLDESYSYGCMYREFIARLNPDSVIQIVNDAKAKLSGLGTFDGDLLDLIKINPKLSSVVASSKLTETNTYVAVMSLVNRGICSISSSVKTEAHVPENIGLLKSKIDAFTILSSMAKQKFTDCKVSFPIDELRQFTLQLNPPGFVCLYLNDRGQIDRESLLNIYSQCRDNRDRVDYFVVRLESVVQFLLQISGDLLPFKVASSMRSEYRNMLK